MLPIYEQKTIWACIATIIVAVAGIISGTLDTQTAVQMITAAIIAIFMRLGIEKTKSK